MTNTLSIRAVTRADVPALKSVLDRVELFPSDMLDAMIAPYLDEADNPHIWFAAEDGGELVALGYCEPERMTDRVWNLLAIAVIEGRQSQGVGTAMLGWLEAHLACEGQRLLLVETSGTSEFEATRRFYARRGFREEARIRDYYTDGDDKIVFVKSVSG